MCPLCHSRHSAPAGNVDRYGHPLTTVLCLNCGLYRSDPLPSPEELRGFYERLYRLQYKGVARPKAHHILRAARAARDRLRWLEPYLPASGAWLDVGAGSGEFAFLLHRRGLAVTALEPNQGYAAYIHDSLQLSVWQGFLEDVPAAAGPFAGISCFHVLEHLPDPVAALTRLRGLLRPDGILAVEVPNSAFEHIHPNHRFHPAHVVHFHPANLELAARAAGLEPRECRPSADGGVIWAVFRPGAVEPARPLPEVVQTLLRLDARRSPLRYYTSIAVWRRTVQRVTRLVMERLQTLSFPSAYHYLSRLPLR